MHAAEKTKGEPVQFVASTCSPSPFLTQVVTLPLRVEGAGLYSTSALPAAGVGLCPCPRYRPGAGSGEWKAAFFLCKQL